MRPTYILIISLLVLGVSEVKAQDDLLAMMEDSVYTANQPISSTWKGMRLISGHTTRLLKPGVMDFVISHRFGKVNDGVNEFFGLDDAKIRLGLEFGITDWLNFGFGRSSYKKTVDSNLKFRLLSQTDDNHIPITISGFTSLAINTDSDSFVDPENIEFSQRLTYSYQLLIARKFNSNFSMQIMPSLVHRNLVLTKEEANDIYALGVGGRYKISKRTSINAEYYPQFNSVSEFTNALSFGVDIETGGHVFQLHVTNSRAMIEPYFIAETTGKWGDGDIHLGFNISRSFDLKSKKDKKK